MGRADYQLFHDFYTKKPQNISACKATGLIRAGNQCFNALICKEINDQSQIEETESADTLQGENRT